MKLLEKRADAAKWLENVYLLLFGILMAYMFLLLTSFDIPWQVITKTADGSRSLLAKLFLEKPYYLLQIVVVLRLLIQEKYDYRKIAGVLVTLGCIWWLWKQSGHDFLLLYGVLILGAQGISFQKIMKVYFLVIGSLFVLTIGCASVGIIENYVYYRTDGSVRHALGLSAPTNFGAVAFYLTMVWWYLRKEKITWPEIGVIAAFAAIVQVVVDSRCAVICMFGTVAVMALRRIICDRCQKMEKPYRMNGAISFYMVLFQPLVAAVMAVLTTQYKDTPFWTSMNEILSNRLYLGKKAMDLFGIKLFGQYIRFSTYTDGKTQGVYFYIDSSYMQLAIVYGIVILGAVLLMYLLIGEKARREQDWTLLWILALITIHSTIEPRLMHLPYNSFPIALLATTGHAAGLELKEIIQKKWIKS